MLRYLPFSINKVTALQSDSYKYTYSVLHMDTVLQVWKLHDTCAPGTFSTRGTLLYHILGLLYSRGTVALWCREAWSKSHCGKLRDCCQVQWLWNQFRWRKQCANKYCPISHLKLSRIKINLPKCLYLDLGLHKYLYYVLILKIIF